MDLALTDRVIVVTGGTDGIGAAVAETLVAEGACVTVCGRDQARLQAAGERLGSSGLAVRADVTQPADLERLVAETVSRWGRIDGVVNNAGRSAAGRLDTLTDDIWHDDLDLKLIASVRLIRLCLPHLRVDGGAIVNVLNTAAKAPGAGSLPTSATRAAGLAVTKALSKELGPDGIRVNALLVGVIESGQWRRRADDRGISEQELYATMGETVPLGRVGTAREFADVAAFLLSPRASYITGSAVNVDGGSSPAI